MWSPSTWIGIDPESHCARRNGIIHPGVGVHSKAGVGEIFVARLRQRIDDFWLEIVTLLGCGKGWQSGIWALSAGCSTAEER